MGVLYFVSTPNTFFLLLWIVRTFFAAMGKQGKRYERARTEAAARVDGGDDAADVDLGGLCSGDEEWTIFGIRTGLQWFVAARAMLCLLVLSFVVLPDHRMSVMTAMFLVIAANRVGKAKARKAAIAEVM